MADLDQLLEGSSRTFALAIPMLPEPTRREVTLAYLLFRVADTLEDSERWPRARRAAELRELDELLTGELAGPDAAARVQNDAAMIKLVAKWSDDPPSLHPGYRALMEQLALLINAVRELDPRGREIILKHLFITIRGMEQGLSEDSGELFQLHSLEALRRYCYFVAGVVGEMLTELFLLHAPLAFAARTLRENARDFGEGLQLTNILKDAGDDARGKRQFIPAQLSRASLLALARSDLTSATRYVSALISAKAPDGLIAFTAVPVRLAIDTLREVEKRGPGAKVSRDQLAKATEEVFAMIRGEQSIEHVMAQKP